MVKHRKLQNYRKVKKQNNLLKFSLISLTVIFSFFSLPTINNFLDKNINFKKSIISNAGVNFDQELEKKKKLLRKIKILKLKV